MRGNLTKSIFVANLAYVRCVSQCHVFHRWCNRFLSAKPSIVNAEARLMSDEIYSSRGRKHRAVTSNKDDAPKTGFINFHYLSVPVS